MVRFSIVSHSKMSLVSLCLAKIKLGQGTQGVTVASHAKNNFSSNNKRQCESKYLLSGLVIFGFKFVKKKSEKILPSCNFGK